MRPLQIAAALCLCAAPLAAQDQAVTYDYDGSFDDATFAVENAIVGKGLVIDYVSHVGDMLERTRADMGSEVVLFDGAQIFVFCSAALSRKMMEADPLDTGDQEILRNKLAYLMTFVSERNPKKLSVNERKHIASLFRQKN